MKFNITLTWSKLVAVLILVLAFLIDKENGSSGTVFMFSLPFVMVMILGKQGIDAVRTVKGNGNL